MKKLLIAVVLFLLLISVVIYLFIPSQIQINRSVFARVSPAAASRFFAEKESWQKWWPGRNKDIKADSILYYGNSSFAINQRLYNAFNIEISRNRDSIHSLVQLVPWSLDTLQIQWNGLLNTSVNPLKRVSQYLKVKATRKEMDSLLSHLVHFLQNQENIYGLQIRREIVNDTLLVFKETMMNAEPSAASIDKLVKTLRTYIQAHGAKETDFPMMNVIPVNKDAYRVMVAIPVNQEVPISDSIAIRRMVRGWILISEVNGGPASIRKAFGEMRNYINDYLKTPIALPFESMITDRIAEPDTSKWITRLYFPVVL